MASPRTRSYKNWFFAGGAGVTLDEDFDDFHAPLLVLASDPTSGETRQVGDAPCPADRERRLKAQRQYSINTQLRQQQQAQDRHVIDYNKRRLAKLDLRLDFALTLLWEEHGMVVTHAPRALLVAAARAYKIFG